MNAAFDIDALIARPDLTRREKLRAARAERKRLRDEMKRDHKSLAAAEHSLAATQAELDFLKRMQDAAEEIYGWADCEMRLGRATGSQLHNAQEAVHEGTYYLYHAKEIKKSGTIPFLTECLDEAQAFVIEHDWAAAFSGATDFASDAFRLPFDVCAFEFVVSARRVIIVAMHTGDDDVSDIVMKPLVRTKNGWLEGNLIYRYVGGAWLPDNYEGSDAYEPLVSVIGPQIKAVSVALEAEVATSDVVRASDKLIASRLRNNRPPPSSYHVVSLASRERAPALESDGPHEHGKVRLHFRRGHWRHYETHKTWIKWMLVGNPDLGFVEKHYRL